MSEDEAKPIEGKLITAEPSKPFINFDNADLVIVSLLAIAVTSMFILKTDNGSIASLCIAGIIGVVKKK